MTKASTGIRRASTARAAAKAGKRALPNGPEQSNAGTRPKVGKRTSSDGSAFCYVDHKTGDIDHMNAHIRTLDCAR